jgi:hypothetical protein
VERGQLGFTFESPPPPDLKAEKLHASRSRPAPRVDQLALSLEGRPDGKSTIGGHTRVESVLREVLGPRVLVSLTSNRSTMISYKRRRGVLYVRMHSIFADAPQAVLHAVATFVSDADPSPRECRLIDDFIEIHRLSIRRALGEKPMIVQPVGEVHDLKEIFVRLNGGYFKDGIEAQITWSRAAKNQKRNSIRMGSYCDEQKLIRVHPALDQQFVPVYFVESVVFHEMLHEYHGVKETEDGRRCVHSPEFLDDERRYPLYTDARRWERKNLNKLLRY